jgi:hypothetical protein
MNRAWFLGLLAACIACAHDIPNDVTIQTYFKPQGAALRVLIRVPMKAMRDVNFPERAGGYMDLARAEPLGRDAAKIWVADLLTLYEGDTRLPPSSIIETRIALESDKSFGTYAGALAHVMGPRLPVETNVVWNQTWLDILLETPIRSDQAAFSVRSLMARLGLQVLTVLRFAPPNGPERAFEFRGDPGLPADLSSKDFGTSWTASTTCCSSPAW